MSPLKIKKHHESCEKNKQKILKAGAYGPWKKEPNRLEWKAHGLECLIVRNPITLVLCGYVGLKKDHSCYEKFYDDVPVEAHGGLTYSDFCHPPICHVTDQSEDKTWWLGFDCAHAGDVVPAFVHSGFWPSQREDEYRNIEYVRLQTEALANQLSLL